jgi:oligoendopeptidase F
MSEKKEIPIRDKIEKDHKWNLAPLYDEFGSWEKEFQKVAKEYPELVGFKGRLSEGNSTIADYIRRSDEISRVLERVYTWAHLKHDEDLRDTTFQSHHDRVVNLMVKIETDTSFFIPELLSLPDEQIGSLMKDPVLDFARVPIRSILRTKDHFLSEKEERILAMSDDVLDASSKTYRMLNDADLTFPSVKDEEGNEVEISHGRLAGLLMSPDRKVRQNTLEGFYSSYRSHKNTFTSILEGEMKKRSFRAKVRNFPSALHASLHGDEVTPDLYNGLIEAVHGAFPDFYRYVDLRKKALKLDELHMYDVYIPLVEDFSRRIPFEKSKDIVLKALDPLGREVLEIVKEGFSSRWIDVYENKGKRSGAYSSGCFDSPPFILMNYDQNIRELFTLAHEMGHSVHTYLSNRNQPHITADYRIFVAEVASTVNEVLLLDHLRKIWTSKDEQIYLVNHYLDSFKGTVFRQTMFAEFERDVQEMVEKDIPLTPDLLCEHYGKLNRDYFGPEMVIDAEIELEWARIPHFYYNFYVYKYATSFSVANAIATRILQGDEHQLDIYIEMLKAGGSKPPVELLKDAGVDLSTPEPISEALKVFGSLITDMDSML